MTRVSLALLIATVAQAESGTLPPAAREHAVRATLETSRLAGDFSMPVAHSARRETLQVADDASMPVADRAPRNASQAPDDAPVPLADRERLREILERPEFGRRNSSWSQFWTQVGEWLRNLFAGDSDFEPGRQAEGFSNFTRYLVLGLAVIAAAIAFTKWLTRRTKVRSHRALTPNPEEEKPYFEHASSRYLEQARELATTDAREAVRHGLLSLLASLEENRWARPERTKTNREVADEMRARGAPEALTRRIRELMTWYDEAYYSMSRISSSEAEDFLTSVEHVETRRDATPPR